MKKFIALFLCVLLIFGLAACSNKSGSDDTVMVSDPPITDNESSETKTDGTSSADNNTSAADSDTKTPSDTTTDKNDSSKKTSSASSAAKSSDGKKVLVVYYSASGSTKRVAKSIAAAANADLFEIVPKNIYTSDDLNWTDKNSRVCREHDDESLRNVPLTTTSVADWADYDTVLIGYPIWWGIAAWPVDNFVKANDFTGKTVIPFCTSASSGLGQSGELLADMSKGGDWQEGERFSSGASDSTVQKWVNSLNLNK